MSRGVNVLFPRSAVPGDVGVLVRRERRARCWSQARLAREAGVERRTILRLEAGRHVPSSSVVHAVEQALRLGDLALVPDWKDPAEPGAHGAWGPRARQARLRAGLSISELAAASGVSAATISRFERELGDTALILSDWETGEIGNEAYAAALGFAGARDMTRHLRATLG